MVPPVRVVMPVVAVVPAPEVVAVASVVAPCAIFTVNWSAALARDVTDLMSVRCGLAVLVMVQVMLSPLAGVSENDVPDPLGSVVADEPLVLEHEIEFVYEAIAETEPAAMASLSVYAVAAVSAVEPLVALTPAPAVVAVASVVAPWVMFTVNWSALFTRLATDLIRVTCGLAVFVMVQEITSPPAGVIAKDVPEPDGSTVDEPAVELVHEIEDR